MTHPVTLGMDSRVVLAKNLADACYRSIIGRFRLENDTTVGQNKIQSVKHVRHTNVSLTFL